MRVDLTDEERKFLREVLDKVAVSGKKQVEMLLGLMEKLEVTLE